MKLHLGCGNDYREGWHNVDINLVECDEQLDITDTPWPYPADSVDRIAAHHVIEHCDDVESVFRECKRVLKPVRALVVTVPIGYNALADPDHKHEWMWQTPEFYCGERHWDVDVGLSVVYRDVTLWSTLPGLLGRVHTKTLEARLAYYGPGVWCFGEPHTSGEFEVTFRA